MIRRLGGCTLLLDDGGRRGGRRWCGPSPGSKASGANGCRKMAGLASTRIV